jgi:hypothetical protein
MVVADAELVSRQDRRRREQHPQPGRRSAADREFPDIGQRPGILERGSICGRARIERGRRSQVEQGRGAHRADTIQPAFDQLQTAAQLRQSNRVGSEPCSLTAIQTGRRSASCREKSLRLWQGVRRDISVGGHVVRRWNPCPDPNRHVADNEQRRGLKPRTGRSRLTIERSSNPLSRIHKRRLGMRSGHQQNCENAEAGRAYRIHD